MITSRLIFWAILLFALIFIEVATSQLVSIWFAVASFVCIFLEAFDVDFSVQLIVFIIVSVLLLLLLRPYCNKYVKGKIIATNADSNIGKKAIALCDFVNGKGRVEIDSMDWAAVCSDDSIAKNDSVIIKKIEGATLVVEREEEKCY